MAKARVLEMSLEQVRIDKGKTDRKGQTKRPRFLSHDYYYSGQGPIRDLFRFGPTSDRVDVPSG